MTPPCITGRRALVRTALLVMALEVTEEVRRTEGQETDPAPPAPAVERRTAWASA